MTAAEPKAADGRAAATSGSAADSRRRTLWRLLLVSGATAAVAVLTAVFAALGPSARTLAERPRVVIPELANGQFAFVGDPRSNQSFPSELLFVRDPDGTLRAWWMPVSRGRVTLPDLHWWRPLARCADFGPDFARGEYRCRDAEVPDWIRNSLRWTLDGKSIPGKPMHHDDMPRVLGTAEGRHFRVDGIDWGK